MADKGRITHFGFFFRPGLLGWLDRDSLSESRCRGIQPQSSTPSTSPTSRSCDSLRALLSGIVISQQECVTTFRWRRPPAAAHVSGTKLHVMFNILTLTSTHNVARDMNACVAR